MELRWSLENGAFGFTRVEAWLPKLEAFLA